MRTITLIPLLFVGVSLMQGCSGINTLGKVDHDCPAPTKDQLNKDGFLMLQNGVTLKCQVKNYTNRMSCTGITDRTGADGWACNNGKNQILFLFDENKILKDSKTF